MFGLAPGTPFSRALSGLEGFWRLSQPTFPFLVGLFVFLVCRPAEAFRCTRVQPERGPSLFWETRAVPWWIDASVAGLSSGAGETEAIASFKAWEGPNCSDLSFPFRGVDSALTSEFVEGDAGNRNAVVFVSEWPYARSAIAITTIAFDTRTGQALDADIELNSQSFSFSVLEGEVCAAGLARVDLRNTLTHEVGHVLGLDHPPASPRYAETTMFASAPPCETKKRTLAEDDIDGLCSIYPRGLPPQPCFPPDEPGFRVVDEGDGYGCRGSRPGGRSFSLGFLALILVLARRFA